MFHSLPASQSAGGARTLGRAAERSDVPRRAADDRRPALRPDLCRHPAGARLSAGRGAVYHDPDLVPPHGYLAFYFWLRQTFACARGDPRRQARQSGMAAGQERRPVGAVLAERDSRPAAEYLSVYRQRSGRGRAGQTAHPGGDHRPPDATADPRRKLRPAARSGAPGRRILRGQPARPAPRRRAARRDSAQGARDQPRPRIGPATECRPQ